MCNASFLVRRDVGVLRICVVGILGRYDVGIPVT
jgi:hypothetical protein